jgi:hypothetical protein
MASVESGKQLSARSVAAQSQMTDVPDPGRARTAPLESAPRGSNEPGGDYFATPSHANSHAHTLEARSRTAVNLTLALVVIALVLLIMAIPIRHRSRAEVESQRLTTELQLTLTELRATIADYSTSHGHFPGAGPARPSDPFWVEHQLDIALRRTSENAARPGGATFGAPTSASEMNQRSTSDERLTSSDRVRRHTFHIDDPVLENPLNRRSNVRFLAGTDPWPLEGDDSSGWLYRPATGEIRANSPGRSTWTGTRFLDM